MSYYGVDYPNYYLAHYRTKGALNKRHKYVAIKNGQYIYDTPTDRSDDFKRVVTYRGTNDKIDPKALNRRKPGTNYFQDAYKTMGQTDRVINNVTPFVAGAVRRRYLGSGKPGNTARKAENSPGPVYPGSEKNYGNHNAKSPNVRRPRYNGDSQENRDSRVRRNYQYRQMREENEARDIARERDAAINSAHRHHDQMEREAKNRAERRLQFARIAGRGISRSDVRTSMNRRGEYISSRNGGTSRGLEGHNDRPSSSQDSMAARRYREYAYAPRNKPGSTHHGETKRPPERKPTYSDRRRRRTKG